MALPYIWLSNLWNQRPPSCVILILISTLISDSLLPELCSLPTLHRNAASDMIVWNTELLPGETEIQEYLWGVYWQTYKARFVCISWTMPYIEGCVRIHDWKNLEEIAEVGLQAPAPCQFWNCLGTMRSATKSALAVRAILSFLFSKTRKKVRLARVGGLQNFVPFFLPELVNLSSNDPRLGHAIMIKCIENSAEEVDEQLYWGHSLRTIAVLRAHFREPAVPAKQNRVLWHFPVKWSRGAYIWERVDLSCCPIDCLRTYPFWMMHERIDWTFHLEMLEKWK